MAIRTGALKAVPYTPVTLDLLAPLRLLAEKMIQESDDQDLANTIRQAWNEAEREVILLNSRLDGLQRHILDSSKAGGFLGLSDDVPLPVAAVGSAGVSKKGMRSDAVIPGVTSITKTLPVAGKIRFTGPGVSQIGDTFNFDAATSLVIEDLTASVGGGNTTFTLSNDASWVILFLGGQATFDSYDWTFDGIRTIEYDKGYVIPSGRKLMALYTIAR